MAAVQAWLFLRLHRAIRGRYAGLWPELGKPGVLSTRSRALSRCRGGYGAAPTGIPMMQRSLGCAKRFGFQPACTTSSLSWQLSRLCGYSRAKLKGHLEWSFAARRLMASLTARQID